jgi:uncharacterized low-complexity protein
MAGIAIAQPSSGGVRKFAAALIVTAALALGIAFGGLAASNKVGTGVDVQAQAALNQGYAAQRPGERTLGESAPAAGTGPSSRLVMQHK